MVHNLVLATVLLLSSKVVVSSSTSLKTTLTSSVCLQEKSPSCSTVNPCCAGLICSVYRGFTECIVPSPTSKPSRKPVVTHSPLPGPTVSPTVASTSHAPVPLGTFLWNTIASSTFNRTTYTIWPPSISLTLATCQALCNSIPRCDFVTYSAATKLCSPLDFEKTSFSQSIFKGQFIGTYVAGELTNGAATNIASSTAPSLDNCHIHCNNNVQCQYATYNALTSNCKLFSFLPSTGSVISFRMNPLPFNYNPTALGRYDYVSNSGVVCTMLNILPNGKVLCSTRPEYFRGLPGPLLPNTDNLSQDPLRRAQVPYGEIVSIFDPITAVHYPSPLNQNLFCHSSILMPDATVFSAGGDDGTYGAAQGLESFLNGQLTFNYTSNVWTQDHALQRDRWYPSAVRAPDGNVWVVGGFINGDFYQPQGSLEIYNPKFPFANNTMADVDPTRLFVETGTVPFAKVYVQPGIGNIWVFSLNRWSIYDQNTHMEIENENNVLLPGFRGGNYPCANALMPMIGSNPTSAVVALFGGGSAMTTNQMALTTVASIDLMAPAGQKTWKVDPLDVMPYGRIISDAILQPNGKILILNGAMSGMTGGQIGVPFAFGAALDIFLYDPTAPLGSRFTILAANEQQQFYHSVSNLLPDGRTIQCGSDMVNYDKTMAYNHRVFAFSPPWLLNGVPRPVIVSISNNDGTVGNPHPLTSNNNGIIYYGRTFVVTFTGIVTGISIMTPGAITHGTELQQRMIFPDYQMNVPAAGQITVTAPANPTILLPGYHMVFLLNGDTPSIAQWIRLMPQP